MGLAKYKAAGFSFEGFLWADVWHKMFINRRITLKYNYVSDVRGIQKPMGICRSKCQTSPFWALPPDFQWLNSLLPINHRVRTNNYNSSLHQNQTGEYNELFHHLMNAREMKKKSLKCEACCRWKSTLEWIGALWYMISQDPLQRVWRSLLTVFFKRSTRVLIVSWDLEVFFVLAPRAIPLLPLKHSLSGIVL